MQKSWLRVANLGVICGAGVLLLAALSFYTMRPSTITQNSFNVQKTSLPKSAFVLNKKAYEAIGNPMLELNFVRPSMRLPDLRNQVVYYGKNGRPDADADKQLLHFAMNGTKTTLSIGAGEKLYLVYDKKQATPAKYSFSPNNAETSIWIEASSQGNEALVKVGMNNEKGELVTEPQANAQFTLPEKEYARFSGGVWEIGKTRVDGTLLARQRARWFGPDLFLDRHGGNEYQDLLGKQGIDFGEPDSHYSVFVKVGECMIWKDDRWNVAVPGQQTLGYPLLVVKKVDERVMNLELWDVEGKGKMPLNLLKANDPFVAQSVQDDFKFVGARTRSQFIFEVKDDRLTLKPHDWLLLTEEGWKKLDSVQAIDDYVSRKTQGILFVFDEVTRKDERQVLVGTVFNPTRSQMEMIEVPMQSSNAAGTAHTMTAKKINKPLTEEEDGSSEEQSSDSTPLATHQLRE